MSEAKSMTKNDSVEAISVEDTLKLALEEIEFGNYVYAKETLRQAIKALAQSRSDVKQEHSSPEDMYIEMHKHLNCPYCCGSGHIEDVKQEYGEPWLLKSTQELAKAMAKEFYPEITQWKVLDDLAGVISQIDNMTTGLIRKPKQEQGEPVAELIKQSRANFDRNFGIDGQGWADWIYSDLMELLDTTPYVSTGRQQRPSKGEACRSDIKLLTDEQMMKLLDHYAENPSDYRYNDPLICFARAIEKAHMSLQDGNIQPDTGVEE